MTKANKAKQQVNAQATIVVSITAEEQQRIETFFAIRGMPALFNKEYPQYLRTRIYQSIKSRKYSVQYLNDIRAFIKKNQSLVSEFLPQQSVA